MPFPEIPQKSKIPEGDGVPENIAEPLTETVRQQTTPLIVQRKLRALIEIIDECETMAMALPTCAKSHKLYVTCFAWQAADEASMDMLSWGMKRLSDKDLAEHLTVSHARLRAWLEQLKKQADKAAMNGRKC
jgi:hypothetical protein